MNNLEKLRLDFPIFDQKIEDHQFIYFDSAATAQMPQVVIDAISSYYSTYKSNVDRGLYTFVNTILGPQKTSSSSWTLS